MGLRVDAVQVGNPSTIDFTPITQRNKIEDVSLPAEFVNYAIIADPKPKLGATGQMPVRVIVEARAKVIYFSFDRFAEARRQFEEEGIELARVNLSGATHAWSDSRTRALPSAISCLPRSILAANSSVISS